MKVMFGGGGGVVQQSMVIVPLLASGLINDEEADKVHTGLNGRAVPASWRELLAQVEAIIGRPLRREVGA